MLLVKVTFNQRLRTYHIDSRPITHANALKLIKNKLTIYFSESMGGVPSDQLEFYSFIIGNQYLPVFFITAVPSVPSTIDLKKSKKSPKYKPSTAIIRK